MTKSQDGSGAASEFLLEEYRLLKSEIYNLDTRVERGISVMLSINALVFAAIYVDVLPGLLRDTVDVATKEQLNAIEQPLAVALTILNAVFAVRFLMMTVHIDKIGAYLAQIEREVYGAAGIPLGWELSLRKLRGSSGEIGHKPWDMPDMLRRYAFWIVLLILNGLLLADVTCLLSLTGLAQC